jgi:hypothetical protein
VGFLLPTKQKKMSEIPSLQLCNLASKHGLKKAREIMATEAKAAAAVENTGEQGTPKKLTADEKKAALVPEFEALGVELPPPGDSFAKWKQALTAAKEAAEKPEGDTGADNLM